MSLHLIVLIGAIICMLLSAFGVGARVNWFSLGWAFALTSLVV